MIAELLLSFMMNARSSAQSPDFSTTLYVMLGLLNDVTTMSGSRIRRFATISFRTLSVAVAVSATMGTAGSADRKTTPMVLYSGRKLCPHSETQCASSTARSWSCPAAASCTKVGSHASRRSGARNTTLKSPWPTRSWMLRSSG